MLIPRTPSLSFLTPLGNVIPLRVQNIKIRLTAPKYLSPAQTISLNSRSTSPLGRLAGITNLSPPKFSFFLIELPGLETKQKQSKNKNPNAGHSVQFEFQIVHETYLESKKISCLSETETSLGVLYSIWQPVPWIPLQPSPLMGSSSKQHFYSPTCSGLRWTHGDSFFSNCTFNVGESFFF